LPCFRPFSSSWRCSGAKLGAFTRPI
jgi:hypothetical protein